MSADNYIAIQKIGPRWYVWHESASNDYPIPDGASCKSFKKYKDANDYAFELLDDIGIVEYGINYLSNVEDAWLYMFQSIMARLSDLEITVYNRTAGIEGGALEER